MTVAGTAPADIVNLWQTRGEAIDRRRPRPGGLSLGRILGAALRILDDEGLDSLSMRQLADVLGTAHTSLYRHVASREELLVQVVDHVLGELRAPPAWLAWRAEVEWNAREFRRVLRGHPAVVPLLTRGQLLGPNAMLGRERGLRALLGGGLGPELAVQAYLTVAHFVIGSALLDTGGSARTLEHRRSMARMFRELSAERYPTVVALASQLNQPDADSEFEFGLRMLLDGIEGRLAGPTELP